MQAGHRPPRAKKGTGRLPVMRKRCHGGDPALDFSADLFDCGVEKSSTPFVRVELPVLVRFRVYLVASTVGCTVARYRRITPAPSRPPRAVSSMTSAPGIG